MAIPALTPLGASTCPQCRTGMQQVALEGHYGQQVVCDLCARCHLVWFDEFESVRLSGLGWVNLLRQMQAASAQSPGVLSPRLSCTRCAADLKPVHNLTRFGRFAALECPRKHGHLQTFSLLLAERGLVRPLLSSDLQTLVSEGRDACCLNCGSAITPGSERCQHCDSPLVVIDMPRLMGALLIRHAEPLPAEQARHVAWQCRGCGAALEPTRTARCEHCHHQVVVPSFVDLRPLLDTVEPLLRATPTRTARPHGERLDKLLRDHQSTGFHRYLRHFTSLWGDDTHPEVAPLRRGLVVVVAVVVVLGWLLFR